MQFSSILRWLYRRSQTQTHNTEKVSGLLSQLFDPNRVAFSDHDFIVQIVFPDIENFLKLKADPLYIERISQDHLSFSDPTNEKRKTRYACPALVDLVIMVALGD